MRALRVITRLDVQGGAERSTLLEVEALAARGFTQKVVTVTAPPTPAAAQRLDAVGVEHVHLPGRYPSQVRSLRRLVRSWSPDLIHAVIFRAEVLTAVATVGCDVPTLVSLVNMQYDPAAVAVAPSPRRLEVVRRWESLVLRHGIDRFHCLTEAVAAHSEQHLGLDRERMTVIPRGRSPEESASPAAVQQVRDELARPDRAMVVNVGRHEHQKGHDLLLRVADALERGGVPVDVVVAGREGNLTASLQAAIESSGAAGRFRLLGERRDVPALLSAADVVAVTSRWEGLGGAVVEALASGSAVVAFGVPAVTEVLGDAAVLVEPFDVDAFAEAVAELLADDERRSALAGAARRRFEERFTLTAVVDELEDLYREVCGHG